MKCPYCGFKETKVTNKRDVDNKVRRRRECLKCRKRFSTYETFHIRELYVIKKDGTRERFSIEKLKAGFEKAFEKRPVSQEKIEQICNQIEEGLRKKGKEIKSSMIGELVMKKLKKTDEVAYIRFASVYREFKDVKDFRNILK